MQKTLTISLLQIVEAKELFDQMQEEEREERAKDTKLELNQCEQNLQNQNEMAQMRRQISILKAENENQRENIRNLTLVVAIQAKNYRKTCPKKQISKPKIAISELSIPKQQFNNENTDNNQIPHYNNDIISCDILTSDSISNDKNISKSKSPKLIDDYGDDYNFDTNQCIYF
jgi:hypothetical protein